MLLVIARKLWIFVLATVGALFGGPAAAQETSDETHWVCWYNNDMTVRCVLSRAAADSDRAERSVKIANPVPGARDIGSVARQIIRAPQELVGAEVSIPLFNEPESQPFVEQLASFSVCYGKADCRITFWRPVEAVAMLD